MGQVKVGWWWTTDALAQHYFTVNGSLCGGFPAEEVLANPLPANREQPLPYMDICAACKSLWEARESGAVDERGH